VNDSTREVFCAECESFYALPHKPLCPVCLDEEMREVRERTKKEAAP
jgi:hypothetical protein